MPSERGDGTTVATESPQMPSPSHLCCHQGLRVTGPLLLEGLQVLPHQSRAGCHTGGNRGNRGEAVGELSTEGWECKAQGPAMIRWQPGHDPTGLRCSPSHLEGWR